MSKSYTISITIYNYYSFKFYFIFGNIEKYLNSCVIYNTFNKIKHKVLSKG